MGADFNAGRAELVPVQRLLEVKAPLSPVNYLGQSAPIVRLTGVPRRKQMVIGVVYEVAAGSHACPRRLPRYQYRQRQRPSPRLGSRFRSQPSQARGHRIALGSQHNACRPLHARARASLIPHPSFISPRTSRLHAGADRGARQEVTPEKI